MPNGILLALLAYANYSFSDAVIKGLGGQFTVFEIGFFVTRKVAKCAWVTRRAFFLKPCDLPVSRTGTGRTSYPASHWSRP
nr:hypothetical protein [Mesorhizobium sp. NFR06]